MDLNESDDEENVTLIDFPQMVSTYHPNASWYFDRDVECMRVFFSRRFGFEAAALPKLATDGVRSDDGDAYFCLSACTGFCRGWRLSDALLGNRLSAERVTGCASRFMRYISSCFCIRSSSLSTLSRER